MATTWDASRRQQRFSGFTEFLSLPWITTQMPRPENESICRRVKYGCRFACSDIWWQQSCLGAPLPLLFTSQHRSNCACLTHGRGNYSIIVHGEFCCSDQEILRGNLKACFNKGFDLDLRFFHSWKLQMSWNRSICFNILKEWHDFFVAIRKHDLLFPYKEFGKRYQKKNSLKSVIWLTELSRHQLEVKVQKFNIWLHWRFWK